MSVQVLLGGVQLASHMRIATTILMFCRRRLLGMM